MMVAFIDEHRETQGVESLCSELPIAPSTYFATKAEQEDGDKRSQRRKWDESLQAEIRRVWNANFQVYGVRKVWHQLKREGFRVARCTIERLMHQMGLQGAVRG